MNADSRLKLEQEAQVFCRYLLSRAPSAYEVQKYVDGHAAASWSIRSDSPSLDAVLISLASRHPFLTRLADAYGVVFFRNNILRRKLVLLLAVIESNDVIFDETKEIRRMDLVLGHIRLLVSGISFGLHAVLGALVILPIRLFRRGHGNPGL